MNANYCKGNIPQHKLLLKEIQKFMLKMEKMAIEMPLVK